jgi:hypothetical protein
MFAECKVKPFEVFFRALGLASVHGYLNLQIIDGGR